MVYAPIVLFVYNRPDHTVRTVEALKQNSLAGQSDLFIFSDAPKSASDQSKVSEVRSYLKGITGFKSIFISENEVNKGLSGSIVSGVNAVLNNYDRLIVLEDDLVTSPYFLEYMNNALDLYEDDPTVGCVHGWNYSLDTSEISDETFFLPGADCWGWATWKRAWDLFEKDGSKLLEELQTKDLEYAFNRRNTMPYVQMLKDQIAGINDSWAIRWHASLFLQNRFCLHPVNSQVRNIGMDGSGTHCDDTELPQNMGDRIHLERIEVEESEWFYNAYNATQIKEQPHKKPIWRRFLKLLKS
jgi:hypothetical protein